MDAFFVYVFPWIFVAVGLLALKIGFCNLSRGYRSRHWPCVLGVITSSQVLEHYTGDGKALIPKVGYNYSVEGIAYSGSRVAFGDDTSYSRNYAQEVCSRYSISQEVPVFYNPSDPASCVLDAGPSHAAWFVTFVGGMFVVAGLAFAWLMLFFRSP